MSIMTLRRTWVIFLSVFALLLVYSVAATLLLDRKGYSDDDWANISFPFWDPIPKAFTEGAIMQRRPIQSVWYGLTLKAVNYNDQATFFLSLGLNIANSLLMGVALNQAFPNRKLLMTVAILFAFFLPMRTSMTYMLSADNLRLAVLLYWLSVIGFQYQAQRPQIFTPPLLPTLAFMLAMLSYEAVAAMPVATALLVLPVYLRYQPVNPFWERVGLAIQLTLTHGIAYVGYLYIRSVYNITSPFALNFGQVIPNYGQYFAILFEYLYQPLQSVLVLRDPIALVVGVIIVFVILGMVTIFFRELSPDLTHVSWLNSTPYIAFVFITMILFGLLPFSIYGISVTSSSNSFDARVYSFAAFGIAGLLSVLVERASRFRKSTFRFATYGLVALSCGVLVSYHMGLRLSWQQNADMRPDMARNLLNVVPNIADDTTLLMIHPSDEHVIDYYMQMFYQNRSLRALTITLDPQFPINVQVGTNGVSTPGKLVPHNQVLIIEQSSTEYRIIDRITPADNYQIEWQDGITELRSNPKRILPPSGEPNRFHRIIGLNPTEEVP